MPTKALISVFSEDRSGLIASITGSLFNLGANLAATNFSVMGTGAEFNAVAELEDDTSLDEVDSELRSLEELKGAQISITPFTLKAHQVEAGKTTHNITVSGGDRPGLIARLCEVFVEFDANIVRMDAEQVIDDKDKQYIIRFSVSLPEQSADKCLATISNTAGSLKLDFDWNTA